MTPALLQKIELLTLNRLELSELLQQELSENPVLEETQLKETEQKAEENSDSDRDGMDDFDYEYFFGEYLPPVQRKAQYDAGDDKPTFETFLADSTSLIDHLNWQLNLMEIDPELHEIAYFIIGNIDEDGYLSMSLKEVAEQLEIPLEKALQAQAVVQSLDPQGVGSCGLQECLLYQIRAAGLEGTAAERLIEEHLDLLQSRRYPEIARKLKCSLDEISEALELIRQFTPRPGDKYNSKEPVYIQPDVHIFKNEEGAFEIGLPDDGMPKLRLSRAYRMLLKQQDVSKDTKSFIRERMRSAMELLKSVDQRQQTIYRVCEAIVQRQPGFLNRGLLALKPMLIKDVAEELGVHSSTISRVVANKYAHTPQGIIELRKFFTVGVESASGENVSTLRVRARIREIIEQEDARKPLSDQKISKMLNQEGIQITRRTVAKYRDQMNIPGSRDRKMAVSLK